MEKKSDNSEIGPYKRAEELLDPRIIGDEKDLKRSYYMLIISQILIQLSIIINFVFFYSFYKISFGCTDRDLQLLLIGVVYGTGGLSLLIVFIVLIYSSVHIIHNEDNKYRKIALISILSMIINGGIFLMFMFIPLL
jgi:hypothetical protein